MNPVALYSWISTENLEEYISVKAVKKAVRNKIQTRREMNKFVIRGKRKNEEDVDALRASLEVESTAIAAIDNVSRVIPVENQECENNS